jgi:hypothetical protein
MIEKIKRKVQLIKKDGYEISVASLIEEDVPSLFAIIEDMQTENLRLTKLLNELTACCEYMTIINGRCVSCEAIR